MTSPIIPVILCGGAGTRLWPASRGERAKQFLPLTNPDTSLFQATLARVEDKAKFGTPMILCGAAHIPVVQSQCRHLAARLIVEPAARNTAPAIALAVAAAAPDDVLLVMSSDHVIADVASFHAAIDIAAGLAADDWLVTFGITPDHPETGFGYIASGDELVPGGYAVDRFVEKPTRERAQQMLAEGNYSWNAGIFLFRASTMQRAMAEHCPAIWAAASAAIERAEITGDTWLADAAAFAASPHDSIDFALMEKAERVAVVPVQMGWSDLGSWQALHAISDKDPAGNAVRGDVFVDDSAGCLVRAGDKRVSIIGMTGVAVIVDGDDILVIPLDRSQDVRSAAKARG